MSDAQGAATQAMAGPKPKKSVALSGVAAGNSSIVERWI